MGDRAEELLHTFALSKKDANKSLRDNYREFQCMHGHFFKHCNVIYKQARFNCHVSAWICTWRCNDQSPDEFPFQGQTRTVNDYKLGASDPLILLFLTKL